MLSRLINDLQNPALCASLLWEFTKGYVEVAEDKRVPLPSLYIVLPVLLHPVSRGLMQSTQEAKGLLAFAGKFRFPPPHLAKKVIDGVEVRFGRDQWLILNERVIELRALTSRSIAMGIACGLIQLDPNSASVQPNTSISKPSSVGSDDVKEMIRNANKMGMMFGRNSLNDIAHALGVAL
jgi:hypothetical protein